jgi:hypothetical protein
MYRQRDIQRNTAFFLGAFGTALGVLGGGLSALGILAWLVPWFAESAPDGVFALVVIGVLVAIIGAWPALDWLLNRRPTLGGPVLAVLGTCLIAVGLVAVICTNWGFTGWLAIVGGVILLPAARLALAGGGTEPLTWRSPRTGHVRRLEMHAELVVSGVIAVVSVGSTLAVVGLAVAGGDLLPLIGLAGIGVVGIGWFVCRRLGL